MLRESTRAIRGELRKCVCDCAAEITPERSGEAFWRIADAFWWIRLNTAGFFSISFSN